MLQLFFFFFSFIFFYFLFLFLICLFALVGLFFVKEGVSLPSEKGVSFFFISVWYFEKYGVVAVFMYIYVRSFANRKWRPQVTPARRCVCALASDFFKFFLYMIVCLFLFACLFVRLFVFVKEGISPACERGFLSS